MLHGKRGEVNGAVLENGTMLRLPPPEAERMQALLQQGQTVAARGVSLVTPLGTVVDVRAIGSSAEQLTELAVPPLRGGPKGELKGKGPKGRAQRRTQAQRTSRADAWSGLRRVGAEARVGAGTPDQRLCLQ